MTVKRLKKKVRLKGRAGSSPTQLPPHHDTPIRLLNEIREHRVDPTSLSKEQRRGCLMVLANGKQSSAELAALFGVQAVTIRRDMREIRAQVGREVRDWGPEEVVGQLAMAADRYSAMAMRQEDPGLAWSIQRDLARFLKDMGLGGESRDGMKITIESLGQGYERVRSVLSLPLDPRLTGEVQGVEDPLIPRLTLDRKTLVPPGPRAEVVIPPEGGCGTASPREDSGGDPLLEPGSSGSE